MFDIALWLAQGLLALFFLAAGLPKVIGRGIDRWVGFEDVPRMLTLVIGVSEVAGAAALALPPLLGAFEWITPLASIGIAVVSLMAGGFHVRSAEWLPAVETALWAALAGSVEGAGSTGPASLAGAPPRPARPAPQPSAPNSSRYSRKATTEPVRSNSCQKTSAVSGPIAAPLPAWRPPASVPAL